MTFVELWPDVFVNPAHVAMVLVETNGRTAVVFGSGGRELTDRGVSEVLELLEPTRRPYTPEPLPSESVPT